MNDITLERIEDQEFETTLELAQDIIKCYLSARDALWKLGILRSERMLQGDFAEWMVSKMFGLKLPSNTVQAGFDAEDDSGRKYQIKSRIVPESVEHTAFDITDIEADFDFLICVFFTEQFVVKGILQVSREVVKELGSQTKKKFSFRWNRETSEDSRIKRLYWRTTL